MHLYQSSPLEDVGKYGGIGMKKKVMKVSKDAMTSADFRKLAARAVFSIQLIGTEKADSS